MKIEVNMNALSNEDKNRNSIFQIIKSRDLAVKQYREGYLLINNSNELSKSVLGRNGVIVLKLATPAEATKEIDKKFWKLLFEISGIESISNEINKLEFEDQIFGDTPPFTIVSMIKLWKKTLKCP